MTDLTWTGTGLDGDTADVVIFVASRNPFCWSLWGVMVRIGRRIRVQVQQNGTKIRG